MKIYAFDDRISRALDLHGSRHFRFSRIAELDQPVQISFMQLGPRGVIGYHPATVPQLFLVVKGRGWVRGEADQRIPIRRGEAAFWRAGEWHESGSDQGMDAVVIEVQAEDFDPGKFLLELPIS